MDPLLCFRLGTVLLSCLPRTQPAVTSPRCGLGVLCRDGVRGVLITPPHSLQRSPAQCSDTKEEANAQRAEIPKHVTSNHREANGTEPCGWSMCIPFCIINLLISCFSAGYFQGFQNCPGGCDHKLLTSATYARGTFLNKGISEAFLFYCLSAASLSVPEGEMSQKEGGGQHWRPD